MVSTRWREYATLRRQVPHSLTHSSLSPLPSPLSPDTLMCSFQILKPAEKRQRLSQAEGKINPSPLSRKDLEVLRLAMDHYHPTHSLLTPLFFTHSHSRSSQAKHPPSGSTNRPEVKWCVI